MVLQKCTQSIQQSPKMYGELNVVAALEMLVEEKIEPIIDHITDLLNSQTKTICSVKINQPILSEYDQLHCFKTMEVA